MRSLVAGLALALAAAASVAAVPAELAAAKPSGGGGGSGHKRPKHHGTKYIATFDDIAISPLSPLLTAPPTPYDGLYFTGVTVQSDIYKIQGHLLPVLHPESGHQTALFSTVTQLTHGSGVGPARLDVAPGKGEHYHLRSLYAGCSINTGLTLIPYECTMTATTVSKKDGTFYTQSFTLPANKTLQKCKFDDNFRHSTHTTLELTGDLISDLIVSATIDNISYELFTKT